MYEATVGVTNGCAPCVLCWALGDRNPEPWPTGSIDVPPLYVWWKLKAKCLQDRPKQDNNWPKEVNTRVIKQSKMGEI